MKTFINKVEDELERRRPVQQSLLLQMWEQASNSIGGKRSWWKRRLLQWAFTKLVPCWHWDKMPKEADRLKFGPRS